VVSATDPQGRILGFLDREGQFIGHFSKDRSCLRTYCAGSRNVTEEAPSLIWTHLLVDADVHLMFNIHIFSETFSPQDFACGSNFLRLRFCPCQFLLRFFIDFPFLPIARLTTLPLSLSRLPNECGILNISQPYRPPRPITGIALLYGDGVCFL
jgi:hypothetical protein